jgi:hypothetical protein
MRHSSTCPAPCGHDLAAGNRPEARRGKRRSHSTPRERRCPLSSGERQVAPFIPRNRFSVLRGRSHLAFACSSKNRNTFGSTAEGATYFLGTRESWVASFVLFRTPRRTASVVGVPSKRRGPRGQSEYDRQECVLEFLETPYGMVPAVSLLVISEAAGGDDGHRAFPGEPR